MSEDWDISGLCRCCHTTGNLRSLGATYSHEGSEEIYSVLLKETFNIDISPSPVEGYASTYCICMSCVSCLRDAARFRRQVYECEARFLLGCYKYMPPAGPSTVLENKFKEIKKEEQFDYTSTSGYVEDNADYDDKKFFETAAVDDEFEDQPLSLLASQKEKTDFKMEESFTKTGKQKAPKNLECEFCTKKFSYSGSLEVHMKVHRGEKMYKCLLCGCKYGMNKDLTKHISEKHNDNGKYSCKFCEQTFNKPAKLRSHLNTHFKERFKCSYCNKDFQRNKNLKEHLKVHSGEKKYSCHICAKSFGHNQTLKTHILTHTGEKPYICDVCGRCFPQRTHLKRHIFIIHTGVKPYSCNVCKKKFSSKSYLSIHERLHTGEKPHTCDVCNKNFTAYTTLKVHMRVHTGFKPYTCSFCSRTFAQMASFKLHERTHTGDRPYSCEICRKRFSDNGYLKVHMRIHTNEKPFSCDTCKRSFRETGQLKRHMRIHTGVKPYTCKICNKQIGNLSKHMKVHADGKPYLNCNTCHRSISVSGSIKLRMSLQNGQILCEQCQNNFGQNSEIKKD